MPKGYCNCYFTIPFISFAPHFHACFTIKTYVAVMSTKCLSQSRQDYPSKEKTTHCSEQADFLAVPSYTVSSLVIKALLS